MGTFEHGEDIFPGKGIEDKVPYRSLEILQIRKEFIHGNQRDDIKMTEQRTGRGHRMDYEEDHLEWG